MKILKAIKSFFSLKNENGETLRDVLFKEYLDTLIKERKFISSDEMTIIKKAWYDGYVYGLKYYRNIQ